MDCRCSCCFCLLSSLSLYIGAAFKVNVWERLKNLDLVVSSLQSRTLLWSSILLWAALKVGHLEREAGESRFVMIFNLWPNIFDLLWSWFCPEIFDWLWSWTLKFNLNLWQLENVQIKTWLLRLISSSFEIHSKQILVVEKIFQFCLRRFN